MKTLSPTAGALAHPQQRADAFRGNGPEELADNLSWRWGFLIFLVSCAVVIARRPDAVFHPQFYAEDGAIWFAQAYNHGWLRVLFWPQAGYIDVFPRLAAALALLVRSETAPLIDNLIAICVQALPPSLLLSPRSRAWGSIRFRVALAILYLALPNTREIAIIVTNSMWILALCAFLVLVAAPPRSKGICILSGAILVLSGLTGPLCIFLLPLAAFLLYRHPKSRWLRFSVATLLACSLIQTFSLLTHHGAARVHPPLGANLEIFLRILGGHVYLGTLLGGNNLSVRLPFAAIACIALAGTLMIAACAWNSRVEMRLLLILAGLVFAASLANPLVPDTGSHMTAWQILARAPGIHYWFYPSLASAWSLAWCLRSRKQFVQITAATLLFFLAFVGVVRDFRYPSFPDLHFGDEIRRLEAAPRGAVIVIPENPQGWHLRLVKR